MLNSRYDPTELENKLGRKIYEFCKNDARLETYLTEYEDLKPDKRNKYIQFGNKLMEIINKEINEAL